MCSCPPFGGVYNLSLRALCPLTTITKRWLKGVKGSLHLVAHRLVLEAGLVEQQLQLSAVEVGHAERLHQTGVFARLHRLFHKRHTQRPLTKREKENDPKQEKTETPFVYTGTTVK